MRVIAGSRRSLQLKSVPGSDTRPTQDRIKETLFNILNPYIPGAYFIDLFSGTGGIGIEALSRGAERAWFVEKDRKAAQIIRENLAFTRFTEEGELLEQDILRGLMLLESRLNRPADVIFADPPYKGGFEAPVLEFLAGSRMVSEDTLIIFEADLKTDLNFVSDLGLEITREKNYKTNKHVFIMREKNEHCDLSGIL